MLTQEDKQKINRVLSHPAFQFQNSKGNDFYTLDKLEALYEALEKIIIKMEEKYLDLPIPQRIQMILCKGTWGFPCNYDQVYASDYDAEATVFPNE